MSISLRAWQAACVDAALSRYKHSPHFFCQATPGAGKSRMAAEIARQLLLTGEIDLVLCFAPSCQVAEGLRKTFSGVLNRKFDGLLGSVGVATTYQGMHHQGEEFWRLLDKYRVFAVFDEIHHCAGHDPLLSNSWGQIILQRIQDRAAYTLALSGTPWRSDERAIALARYSNPEGRLICDFRYGIEEAISDKVCRPPRIVLIDNNAIRLTEQVGNSSTDVVYPSIAQLLTESPVNFEDLLSNDEIVQQTIELGSERLNEIRKVTPNAAGLVVATNVRHANQIASILRARGESCLVVTNQTPGAQGLIDKFRNSNDRWIVAVGMISEGTDIPRLQVCCYLSRIRTELHYRQVLGRVLRRMGDIDEHAWLYALAEPLLQQFSQRIAEDLPEDLAVLDYVQGASSRLAWTKNSELDAPFDGSTEISIHRRVPQVEGEISFVGDVERKGLYELDISSSFRTEILAYY